MESHQNQIGYDSSEVTLGNSKLICFYIESLWNQLSQILHGFRYELSKM